MNPTSFAPGQGGTSSPPPFSDISATAAPRAAGVLQLPTPIAMLGIPFDRVTSSQTIEVFAQMIASGKPHYVATANVDFGVQSLGDMELQRILAHGDLVLCDGTPLVWCSRLLGNPVPERVAGSDIVPELLAESERKGWRVFFLGGTTESVRAADENVRKQYPKLNLVGAYSPPFKHLIDMDHQDIARRIREARPDILLVAFGCPKQEKWIGMHYREAGVPISIGVGATIDFLAGQVSRAPVWMRRTGLEWVYRLCQEPKRLFRRYSKDLFVFGNFMLRQWWLLGGKPGNLANGARMETLNDGAVEVVHFEERIDVTTSKNHDALWTMLAGGEAHILLDASRVKSLDSTGVGLLIRLQKQVSKSDRQLVLIAPTGPVLKALTLMAFSDFFPVCPDIDSGTALIRERLAEESVVAIKKVRIEESMIWQGDISAANIAKISTSTRAQLDGCTDHMTDLNIDLSAVRYLDSAGVGLMVRTRKEALGRGIRLRFTEPSPAVKNVLRILHLENLLQS